MWSSQQDNEYAIENFCFASGQRIAALRIRYTTLGRPRLDARGIIDNAVLLLHGTGGTSQMWLQPSLADELFAPGQALDVARYYIIIPDGIGRGGSSKPSDGLKGQFPNYRYRDMVEAQYRLVTEALGVRRLALVAGTSMGGMHAWIWGGLYPTVVDRIVPIACQPAAMSGRNWLHRRITIEAIRNDPAWKDGDYSDQPRQWTSVAPLTATMTDSVLKLQAKAPTRETADALYQQMLKKAQETDTNDILFATEAAMDYDPASLLKNITCKVLAINFEDDQINPPELPTQAIVQSIPRAKYILIPASAETGGHHTYMSAKLWQDHLARFMAEP